MAFSKTSSPLIYGSAFYILKSVYKVRENESHIKLRFHKFLKLMVISREGGFESRLRYLKDSIAGRDDICFVSWTQEDKGKEVLYMKEKTYFWKCNLEYSTKNYQKNIEAQRVTRADYDKIIWGKHVKPYYKKNYATDVTFLLQIHGNQKNIINHFFGLFNSFIHYDIYSK